MLLTAAAIRQFRSARSLTPWQTQLIFDDTSSFQYACHMGFFQSAGFVQGKAPGEAPGSMSYIPLTKIDIVELMRTAFEEGRFLDQGDIIEIEAKRLSRVLSQGQPEFPKLLQYILTFTFVLSGWKSLCALYCRRYSRKHKQHNRHCPLCWVCSWHNCTRSTDKCENDRSRRLCGNLLGWQQRRR